MFKEEQTLSDSLVKVINWFENGQLQSIVELGKKQGTLIKNTWERDGTQIVKDGNGWAKIKGNSYNARAIYEEGTVVKERKSGKWIGKFADSTLAYEEFLEKVF